MESESARILVVDDDPHLVRATSRMLSGAGHEVTTAETGAEGLRLALEQIPDLILLDVVLPDMDGVEVCRRIKGEPALAGCFVVLASSIKNQSSDQANGLEAGAEGYLARPISNRELLARVEALLRLRRAEKALREERDRAQKYLDIAGVIIVALDATRTVTLINKKGRDVLGFAEDEIIGCDWFDTFLPARVRGGVRAYFDELIADRITTVEYVENPILTRSGDERLIAWHNSVLTDETGQVVGTLSSGEDITQRKAAEVALTVSNRELADALAKLRATQEQVIQQERLAAVGQLAAGIAHDFNNILGSVILATDMLRHQQGLAPEAGKRLLRIKGQSQRAAHLVQQLLDFSRKSLRRLEPFDLALLLQEWFENSQRDFPPNVDVWLDMGPGPYLIQADRAQIRQILANLTDRARDAMLDGGAVTVGLRDLELTPDQLPPLPDMPPGRWSVLTVTDTGVGLPPEVLPHVFEPFFTATGIGENTGLALAQVYGIVMQHEGYIQVSSQVEKGTLFTIFLPALDVERRSGGRAGDLPQGSGETILLMMADELLLSANHAVLEDLGYQTLTALDSPTALELLDQHSSKIALVLLDSALFTPEGTGLLTALGQSEIDVKVVIISQQPSTDTPAALASRGVQGWIQKPITIEQLAQTVRMALGQETTPGSNPQPRPAR